MFSSETTLNEFNRDYLKRLMADIGLDDLDRQPHPQLHSVRWILAHLAIVVDYGFMQLGLAGMCDPSWHAAYGPGSQPGTAGTVCPSVEELLATIETGYDRLCQAARGSSIEQVNALHEVGILKGTSLRTKGDLLSHILTTHFATHLGQLSTLRQLAGRRPLI